MKNLKAQTLLSISTFVGLAIASYFAFVRSSDCEWLVRLPGGTGPFPHDANMIRSTELAIGKCSNDEAVMCGIGYLWRVRDDDPAIGKFIDSYCETKASPIVIAMVQLLEKNETQTGKEP